MFSVRVTEDGRWRTLGEPQRVSRTACMMLAAYILTRHPDVQVSPQQVEDAVRHLAVGAQRTRIGDHPHTVCRTDLYIDVELGRLGEPLLWFMR